MKEKCHGKKEEENEEQKGKERSSSGQGSVGYV